MDSSGLPSIQDSRDVRIQGHDKELGSECPDVGRKAMTSQVRRCPQYCSVLAIVFNMFFPFFEVANAGTTMWKFVTCKTSKVNTVFTAAMAGLVPKYIYG